MSLQTRKSAGEKRHQADQAGLDDNVLLTKTPTASWSKKMRNLNHAVDDDSIGISWSCQKYCFTTMDPEA